MALPVGRRCVAARNPIITSTRWVRVARASSSVSDTGSAMPIYADFVVPEDLIAQTPADPPDSSRLMVVRRKEGTIEHKYVRHWLVFFRSLYDGGFIE